MEYNNADYWYFQGCNFYCLDNNKEALKCFEMATQLDSNNSKAFFMCGVILRHFAIEHENKSLFGEACEKFNRAAQTKPDNMMVFEQWGNMLYFLIVAEQYDALPYNAVEEFEIASEKINDSNIVLIKIGLSIALNKTNKAIEYLKIANVNILDIFTFVNNKYKEKIIQTDILYPLLDLNTIDGLFFRKATSSVTDKIVLDRYKKVYILSISIIRQLHVCNIYEKSVAHYLCKTISQKILFDKKSKIRLNAINYSNDPTEGKTLLDYLFGEDRCPKKETLNTEYGAFAGCFTFNHDSLNQFRLYGKENWAEGVGLSLIFRNSFFCKDANLAMNQHNSMRFSLYRGINSEKEKEEIDQENDKLALFRCIYIDPVTRRVVTVGQKEEYLFYRENSQTADKDYDEYHIFISDIIKNVKNAMEELKVLVSDLEPAVIGRLLINLRYLTKHVAFKEEQECRIVKICHLTDEQIKIPINEDYDGMCIEYEPKVLDHIEKIYFGPKATDMELFQDMLAHKRLNIPCKRSENPLA